jgi:hypothetical protein
LRCKDMEGGDKRSPQHNKPPFSEL